MDWVMPPTLVRMTIFTQLTESNANLFQRHPHGHTEIRFYQLSGHPLAQSGWQNKPSQSSYTSMKLIREWFVFNYNQGQEEGQRATRGQSRQIDPIWGASRKASLRKGYMIWDHVRGSWVTKGRRSAQGWWQKEPWSSWRTKIKKWVDVSV